MSQYMLLLPTPRRWMRPEQSATRGGAAALFAELHQEPARGRACLVAVPAAALGRHRDPIRVATTRPSSSDGPFAMTKEILVGYYILDCADLDAALERRAELPLARYGSVEVRPLMPPGALARARRAERVSAASGGRAPAWPEPPPRARAFREDRGAVLATLIRQVGDFQLAEDAVQDAFEAALTPGARDGVPANPGAWLTTAARRQAIDRLRRGRAVPTARDAARRADAPRRADARSRTRWTTRARSRTTACG